MNNLSNSYDNKHIDDLDLISILKHHILYKYIDKYGIKNVEL